MSFLKEVVHGDHAPDAAGQQLLVVLDHLRRNQCIFNAEVGELGFVNVFLLIELYRYFINDLVGSSLTNERFHLLCFIRADVVISQNTLNVLQPLLDDLVIVGSAVHTEQILQHIDRDICPFFELFSQVLTYYPTTKMLIQQGVQIVTFCDEFPFGYSWNG